MYMAHTESGAQHVTHRLKRTRHLEDGCWMGIQRKEETPGHQQEAVRPASEGGGWSGVNVNGVRQHARASLECNHHCKNMRVCTF